MNKIKVFTQHYPINSTILDTNGQLGLIGMLNLIQDVSILHPETFGLGYKTCLEDGYFWVLSQQKLQIKRWPTWHETIALKTWVRDIGCISATRECILSVGNELVAECAMSLIRVDIKTRRPKRISDTSHVSIVETGNLLDFKAGKIRTPDNLNKTNSHTVKISDLDLNQHVNNTKYAEWFLDTLPISLFKHSTISCYEVNFIAETFLGENIDCLSNFSKDNVKDNSTNPITFCGK